MDRLLEFHRSTFNKEEKKLLITLAGHIIPPLKSSFEYLRLEPSSLVTDTSIISAILCFVAFFQDRYIVSGIALYIFIISPKIWKPSPFYFTNNYTMKNMALIDLYLKAQGKNIKKMSEDEIKHQIAFVILTINKLHDTLYVYGRLFEAENHISQVNSTLKDN